MKLFAILSLVSLCPLLLAGCPPKKPNIRVGVIDYPRNEVIAGQSEGGPILREPLSDWDKATCMRPKEWEKYQNWVDKLQSYAEKKPQ